MQTTLDLWAMRRLLTSPLLLVKIYGEMPHNYTYMHTQWRSQDLGDARA